MNVNEIPAELAGLKPFVQRGLEMQGHDQVMAYYCFFYSAQQAMELKGRSKEATAFLLKLMDELETIKKNMAGNECITNMDVGYSYCENFALKIFLKADNEDRSGQASKKTAMTFLASSVFLQIVKLFSDQVESFDEIDEKIKYAKWKAADIAKAIKEGRQPTAGPSGAADPGVGDISQSVSNLPVTPPAQQPPSPTHTQPTIKPAPAPVSHTPAPKVTPAAAAVVGHSNATSSHGLLYDPKTLDQAQKYARYAISALQYEDLKTAIDNLEKALGTLKPLYKN